MRQHARLQQGLLRSPVSPRAGRAEIAALRAWGGRFAPELLHAQEDGTAFLVERIRPGTPALDVGAEEVARLLQGLHVIPPAAVPSLETVVRARLVTAASHVTDRRLAWASGALGRLAAAARPPVLLHGALRPATLLRCARRRLCAVEPSPCAGDAAYDAACWIHADGMPGRRARFEALSATTDRERARLRDWCGVVAVHGAPLPMPR